MPDAHNSMPLVALEAVALDLETTGLDPRTARVVQIGAVQIANGHLLETARFEQLVNPGIPIPREATAIHGISDEAVAGAPPLSSVLPDLESFIGDRVVVGHTVAYDLAVLEREYGLAGRPWHCPRNLDTGTLARLVAPTRGDQSLDRLCDWVGVSLTGRHTAIGDAAAAARLLIRLIPMLRDINIRTLAEAEAASRRLTEGHTQAAGRLAAASMEQRPPGGSEPLQRIDSFPYRHLVRDVMSTPPLFADPSTTVRAGIRLLLEKKVSSVYVRCGEEFGIVTERDLLRAVDAHGASALDMPLQSFASSPLQTVPEDAFVYRAIGRLDRIGFRHLGVSDATGSIVGAVTTRNLLRHRARAALVLGDEIDSASTVAAMAAAWAKLPAMARGLVAEDVDPRSVSAVISSEIRALTQRAARLAEARLAEQDRGPPPVPYAVLVLGSAGRGESLLAADQDNAIVYEKGNEGGPEDRWFEALGIEMCQMLHEVGVPLCKGGIMARNRAWRMSIADWKGTIDGWVRRQRPEDLLNIDIFFDGVAAHGDSTLGDGIWNYAYETAHAAPDFVKLLIEVARQRTPAFTLFGGIRVDEKRRIDLKKVGLMPIFTCARVLSIRHDVRARSTPDRLRGVAARGIGSEQEIDEIIEAHKTILGAMLSQQLADAEDGSPLSPRVNPDRLGKRGKRELAKALRKVDAVVDLVAEGRL